MSNSHFLLIPWEPLSMGRGSPGYLPHSRLQMVMLTEAEFASPWIFLNYYFNDNCEIVEGRTMSPLLVERHGSPTVKLAAKYW